MNVGYISPMHPKALLQCHFDICLALTPALGKAKSFLAAQKILYRLFYLAQIQNQLACRFDWPSDAAQLWATFLKSERGELGFAPLKSFLWKCNADDHKWASAAVDFPKLLWSKSFQAQLQSLSPLSLAQIHEWLMESEGKADSHLRRKTGSYYTQQDVAHALLTDGGGPSVLSGSVCDPACGGGVFLMTFAELWQAAHPSTSLTTCLTTMVYGVDINRLSVELCRMNLWLMAKDPKLSMAAFCQNIRWGNALLCPSIRGEEGVIPPKLASQNSLMAHRPFDWRRSFPRVFQQEDGFSWLVGNPPWIAHAGRAAQPLAEDVRAFYLKRYRSFYGYRTTHGLFCELAAELCSPQRGQVAFIVPTSVADLKGYGPTREAVTHYVQPLEPLSNMGDGVFASVFQPCMFLRTQAVEGSTPSSGGWALRRDDFSEAEHALLKKLLSLAPFPKETFGERGLQSSGDLKTKFQFEQSDTHTLPLAVGRDVHAFEVSPCSCWARPDDVASVLKSEKLYKSVDLWIRQTSAYPIAVKSLGTAFRNSLLAGYSSEAWSSYTLLGLLNSPTLQWFHHQNFRDAREGMPQVKINHLRSYPAPPNKKPLQGIEKLAQALSTANSRPSDGQFLILHELVARAYDLSQAEADRIWTWFQKR